MPEDPSGNHSPTDVPDEHKPQPAQLSLRMPRLVVPLAFRAWIRLMLRRYRPSSRTLKAAGTFITGLATVVGAVAAFVPFDDDSQGDRAHETPTSAIERTMSVTLSDVTVAENHITLGEYCSRRGDACASADQRARDWPGILLLFDVQADGYASVPIGITWTLHHANGKARVSDPALVDQQGWPDGIYTPLTHSDRNSAEIWVAYPRVDGEYFVRLQAYPPAGTRLDSADSEVFQISQNP